MTNKQKPFVRTRKVKGDTNDFYYCVECGKRWTHKDKVVGHTSVGCARYLKK